MKNKRVCLTFLLMLTSVSANSSPIFYTTTDLNDGVSGVDLWQYEYFIGNDTGFDISTFSIYFDFELYDFQLSETFPNSGDFFVADSEFTAPDTWGAFVAPDVDILGVLEPGFYNISSLTGPLNSGTPLLDGFSVTFAFDGFGMPGSQFFEYFGTDASGNPIEGSSFTQLLNAPQPVNSPGTLVLVLVGLLAMARQLYVRRQ